jgi:hypothetical protein
VPSRCWRCTTWYQKLHKGPGYLCLCDAVLDFLDELLGRRSFTGDGGKGEDEGSRLWLEIEEKQLNGFLSFLLSESSDWLFRSCPTGEILSDSGRRQLQRAPTGGKIPLHNKNFKNFMQLIIQTRMQNMVSGYRMHYVLSWACCWCQKYLTQ